MTVFLQTTIISWRGRRRVIQPFGAHKERCVQRVDGRLPQARSSAGVGRRVLQPSASAEADVRREWMRIACSRLPSSVDVAGVASCSHQGEQTQRFPEGSCRFFFRLRSSAGVAGVGSCSKRGAQKETCVQRVDGRLPQARSSAGVVGREQKQMCAAV